MRKFFFTWTALFLFTAISASAQSPAPLSIFKDCEFCPEMLVIPTGEFMMGVSRTGAAVPHAQHNVPSEKPRHKVTIGYEFAIGKFEVTAKEFAGFVEETSTKTGGKCGVRLADRGPQKHKFIGKLHPASKKLHGKNFVYISDGSFKQPGLKVIDRQPAVCISRIEAKAYLEWLSTKTGRRYRLPTEAEWEYATRAGTNTAFFWGKSMKQACRYSNFADKGSYYMGRAAARCREKINPLWTAPVGSYEANVWGLHDTVGNVQEMLEDCWHDNYRGAPTDGSPWMGPKCAYYIARGGDYELPISAMRSSERLFYGSETEPHDRYNLLGFRAAVSLSNNAWDKK